MARAFRSAHWTFLRLRTVLAAVTLLAVVAPARAELVVYTAQLIRTMEPALPDRHRGCGGGRIDRGGGQRGHAATPH